MNEDKKVLPNITSLRFFLAFFVVIFHCAQFFENRGFPFFNKFPIFHRGSDAVYVFFSLSGFLIIRQLYSEKLNQSQINLKNFFLRRVNRIFPLYYLILFFGLIYYWCILPLFGIEFENNYNLLSGLFLAVTFFSNIFVTYSPGGIIEVLWSIGIEEQFYLIIAPLMFFIKSKSIGNFLIAFTIVLLLAFYFYEPFFVNFQLYFFYFSFAGFLSIQMKKKYFIKFLSKMRYFLLAVFFVHFFTNFFTFDKAIIQHSFNLLLFSFTICTLSTKKIFFFEKPLLIYLGKISYGIYMYHAIMMQIVGFFYLKILSKCNFHYYFDVVLLNLLVISSTVVISHFSYKYFESFFLKK
jgi:peptidoglycan/LPS O-acetylase OafA/YrhL